MIKYPKCSKPWVCGSMEALASGLRQNAAKWTPYGMKVWLVSTENTFLDIHICTLDTI